MNITSLIKNHVECELDKTIKFTMQGLNSALVVWISPMNGEIETRLGYYPDFLEARHSAFMFVNTYATMNVPFIVYLNSEVVFNTIY